jgi:thiol-disulfide isomerase/thioredoxin
MRRLLGALGLSLALTGTLAVSGCTSLPGSGSKGYVTGDGSLSLVASADRGDALELTGEDLDGKRLDLADLRGRPTVVSVWGSWCAPCNAEAPDLVRAANRLEGTANVVGIDVRDSSQAQARSFVRKYDVPYPSFYSPDGKALLSFAGTLGANSVPATVVLDADGRVAASVLGTIPSVETLVDVVHDVAGDGTGDGAAHG